MLDLTVLSVWHVTSIWLETCPCLGACVVHCLSDFVTCVSLVCVCAFYFCFNILLSFNGEIKMCVKWTGGNVRRGSCPRRKMCCGRICQRGEMSLAPSESAAHAHCGAESS